MRMAVKFLKSKELIDNTTYKKELSTVLIEQRAGIVLFIWLFCHDYFHVILLKKQESRR
jgi:hypothetical protein